MIDEKKIEEAASAYAEKSRWEATISEDEVRNLCKKLFKDGAHWAIQELLKGLWHDAKEEPKAGEYLYIDSYGQIEKSYRIDNDDPWDEEVRLYEIIKWLQIDDLLPKQKGGEQ